MKIQALGVAFAFAASAVAGTWSFHPAAPPEVPELAHSISIAPTSARVFTGGSIAFRVATAGTTKDGVAWSVIGPGRVDAHGVYYAPPVAGDAALVVASANGSASAALLTIVGPPSPTARLAFVSCYDGPAVDVRDARTLTTIGSVSTGAAAAGIAADAARRIAYVAGGDRLAAFDVRSAATTFSTPIAGVRYSEVAMLAGGFAAATDNNAQSGHAGVRIFRVDDGGIPTLRSSVSAGETPEGIAVSTDGLTFYVTNVNGNSVMRFRFDGRGLARLSGAAPTGHRPFGVALDDRRGLLFVADNDTPTVSGVSSRPGLDVFALPSLRRVARLVTGTANALPLGVAVDSRANRLFVTNEGDGTVAAYSVEPLRRLATLSAGRTPWLPALDAAQQRLYVPSAMGNAFSVFDESTLRSITRATPTCGYPTSIAIL